MSQDHLRPAAQRIASHHRMAQRIARRYLMEVRAKRIASQWVQGMEFDTEEARKKYLKEHPGADPKRHTVKERGKDKGTDTATKATREKLKSFLSKVKGMSKSMAEAIKRAPENTQKFIADPEFRREQTKAAATALRKRGEATARRIYKAAKGEAHSVFVDTPKIIYNLTRDNTKALKEFSKLPKEERTKEKLKEMVRTPSKKEIKTLYGSAVYAGGIALAVAGGPAGAGLAGAASAGATAFAHSFTLHIGFKAVQDMLDEGFLGYEALETMAGTAGQMGADTLTSLLPSSSALYAFSPWAAITKGLGAAKDIGSMILGAEEDQDQDKIMEDFIAKLMKSMADVLDKGISDEDMKKILAEDHEPSKKEAARKYEPLDPSKNPDYGPPYTNEYNWEPKNRGTDKCFYKTRDPADRCYVTTNGGPGGQKKPKTGPAGGNHSKTRSDYNKKYRKQRKTKKGEDLIPLNWIPLPEST